MEIIDFVLNFGKNTNTNNNKIHILDMAIPCQKKVAVTDCDF